MKIDPCKDSISSPNMKYNKQNTTDLTRPSTANVTRHSTSINTRPSTANQTRPSTANLTRPSTATNTRPSTTQNKGRDRERDSFNHVSNDYSQFNLNEHVVIQAKTSKFNENDNDNNSMPLIKTYNDDQQYINFRDS